MVPIYICEDERPAREFLQKMIENFLLIYDYDMEIVLATADPCAVIKHRENQQQPAIYFFDVDLQRPDYNGFTLAKEIRKLDARGFLVFVTTHEELIFETFKYRLEAMSYLEKDQPELLKQQVQQCLSDINQLISSDISSEQTYYTITGDTSYQIPLAEIIFFETAAPHRLVLHSKNRRIEFRGDLKKVQEEVGADFIKVHRSYLVKASSIAEINFGDNQLVMQNNATCLLSRQGKRALKEYLALHKNEGLLWD
ncbi:LytR/AlgR family response regulator transcription factor [Enterococcus sp. LJL120]